MRPRARFRPCGACKARGESGNYLREGDSVYVHRGNHLVISKNLYPPETLYVDCPGPEPALARVTPIA